MKKDESVYLRHILDAIAQIETYLSDKTFADFDQSRLIQDAVIRQLEIVGEASRNLSDEFRQRHSGIPWQQIVGLRNRLIHAYFSINLQTVWEIVKHDLPGLKTEIQKILDE